MTANDNVLYLCDLELCAKDWRVINSILDILDEYIEENNPSVDHVCKIIDETKFAFQMTQEDI